MNGYQLAQTFDIERILRNHEGTANIKGVQYLAKETPYEKGIAHDLNDAMDMTGQTLTIFALQYGHPAERRTDCIVVKGDKTLYFETLHPSKAAFVPEDAINGSNRRVYDGKTNLVLFRDDMWVLVDTEVRKVVYTRME
jgi:hypothetical protein